MTLFTDFTSDGELQYQYGWIYIGLILITFFVNLMFIFLDIINHIRVIIIMIYNNRNDLTFKIIDLLIKQGIIGKNYLINKKSIPLNKNISKITPVIEI
jgi:hypothetical protein